MLLQKLGALLVMAACVVGEAVGAIPASAEEPTGDRCRRECQETKDERDAICRGLRTRKARGKCWRSSTALYAKCVKKCKAGPQ